MESPERFPPHRAMVDCTTGETTVEHHTADHAAWREHVARADKERDELEAKADRRAAALKLVKDKAEEDPYFAAILELVT